MSPSKRWGDRFPPRSAPRPVADGLTARSARGDIGESWWSRRFIDVLESFAIGSRLTRGRSYARKGQVVSLEVAPGTVTARVQGSRSRPYTVQVGLEPFAELVWAKVEVALTEQAIHSARLLAGQMPPDLEDVFAAAGAPLFPGRIRDLTMYCSCPDDAVPCKHLAATFYLLAESFDDDPFRILHWRGRSRERLLARLRELRSGPEPEDEPDPATPAPEVSGAARALADLPVTSGDRFWQDGAVVPPLPTHPVVPVDLLLRQLPEPPAELGGPALQAELRRLYSLFAD